MNVLVTIALIAALAMWAVAVYTRLASLRMHVKNAWTHLDGHFEDAHARATYNVMVDHYNKSLESFPANLIAPLSGFKPARRFEGGNPPDPPSAV